MTVSDALLKGKKVKPVLIEKTPAWDGGSYTTKWYCDPPPEGVVYRVIKDEWCHRSTVRKILKIEIMETRRVV